MNPRPTVEQLLRWRLARAEAEAPPAPRAARLLERARPWWETWPELFADLAARLSQMEVSYGHAMADARRAPSEHLVPALIVHSATEIEASARILYFCVRNGQLHLRFQLGSTNDSSEPTYDATFVSRVTSQPLFSGLAERSANCEYSLAQTLSEELAAKWAALKVTDPMPFRLILRSAEGGA
jgi:hypothetical protein